jgi:hypothetical protein
VRLAKISEEENFAIKNRFQHQKKTMNFAKKENMPVDKRKVKDILRNQHIVRNKIHEDLPTYREFEDNTQFSNGVLTYVNEAAWGDLRELLKDIGINNQTIRFSNVADMVKAQEGYLGESDKQFKNL